MMKIKTLGNVTEERKLRLYTRELENPFEELAAEQTYENIGTPTPSSGEHYNPWLQTGSALWFARNPSVTQPASSSSNSLPRLLVRIPD